MSEAQKAAEEFNNIYKIAQAGATVKKEKRQRKKKTVLADAPAPTEEAVVVVKVKRPLPEKLKAWTTYHAEWFARHEHALKGISLIDRTRLAGLAYRLANKKPRDSDPATTPFP